MTTPSGSAANDELQFDTVEPAPAEGETPGVQGCAACKRPITSEYFAVGADAICPECRAQLDPPVTGTRFTRLLKAITFGLAAGLVGALLWYIVRRVTEYEIGLIAIVVGFMVGKAVRVGSGHRGGRAYQVIAVVLTYTCIAANYMPDIASELLKQMREEDAAMSVVDNAPEVASAHAAKGAAGVPTSAPTTTTSTTTPALATAAGSSDVTPHEPVTALDMVIALVVVTAFVFVFSMATPFLMGAQNIIGLLIIGFALWEAWKFNRRVIIPVTGPYRVGEGPPIEPTAPADGSDA